MPRPTEPRDGQDDGPDLRTALHATISLLADVHERLDHRADDHDLALRARAVRRALQRLRDRL
jgi:hypothetical protein